jgi:pimeloyl-ACP methyl ester carboxylesterase
MQAFPAFLAVPGGRLWLSVDGPADGLPLTLIHAGVATSEMYEGHVPAFVAAGFRVIRYDTRGFGRTETENVPFSNRDDIAAVLDHLDVESTHLVGQSRGGTIALDFTLERPERVRSLGIIASNPSGFEFDDPDSEPFWERMEALEQARDFDTLIPIEVDYWLEGPGQPRGRTGPELRALMERWGHENYDGSGREAEPQPLEPRAAKRLGEVRVPTLVAWGDLDEPAIQAAGPVMRDGIAGTESYLFRGAAHMVNLEQPDEFERLVLELARRGEASHS